MALAESISPAPPSRIRRVVVLALVFFGIVLLFTGFHYRGDSSLSLTRWGSSRFDSFPGADEAFEKPLSPDHGSDSSRPANDGSSGPHYTSTIVTGRLDKDVWQVEWIRQDLKDITEKAVYIVDDPSAPLHLKKNHGRESMVYLRYILDHYDRLNDITFFFHAHSEAWHNNVLLGEGSARTVNMMNRSYIMEKGYVNSRCESYPGCPDWIKFNPSKERHFAIEERLQDMFTPGLWKKLFPEVDDADFPEYLAQPCCSQFAVSRDTIRSVPYETYERLHDWIGDSSALDGFTGRAMEYLWQYIFLGESQVCPNAAQCYCSLYGVCLNERGEHLMEQWQTVMDDKSNLESLVPFLEHKLKNKGVDPNKDKDYRQKKDQQQRVEKAEKNLREQLIEKYALKD